MKSLKYVIKSPENGIKTYLQESSKIVKKNKNIGQSLKVKRYWFYRQIILPFPVKLFLTKKKY